MPFTLSVQARSALMLRVQTSQSSRIPGSTALLEAALTDSGIPLQHSATVRATVTAPGGGVSTVPLHPDSSGLHRAAIPTTTSGVYRVLVRAEGADLRGAPFTREELRTVAVWARGDDRPPLVLDPGAGGPGGLDTCTLLLCLLGDDGVQRFLKNQEIDPDRVARCLKRACR